jgi:hypothetical protein
MKSNTNKAHEMLSEDIQSRRLYHAVSPSLNLDMSLFTWKDSHSSCWDKNPVSNANGLQL